MRVLFSSTRGIGHLEPLLPYAKALRARDHEVIVASPVDLCEAVQKANLEHVPLTHPGDEGLAPLWAQVRTLPPDEIIAFVAREIFAGATARAALPDLLATVRSWKPDLVVRDSVEFASAVAAESSRVPHVRVGVHQRVMEEQLAMVCSTSVDLLRGMAGLVADDGAALRAEPIFTAFPVTFEGVGEHGPKPFRIGPSKTVLPAQSDWRADPNSPPLVYVTFGTVATNSVEAVPVYRTAIAAVAELPVRALLTTGRGFDTKKLGAVPKNVRVEPFVPQAEVLPFTAVMVCHGGSGTVLGGLAAGVPQVVVPLGADQPQNAERIAAIGAGLALRKPDATTLRAAITRVLAEPAFRDAARVVAAEMATLPSANDAVDALIAIAGV
jgi:UDP:flavonoid glycosyltransferase YjiC (YdhE family)